MLLNTNILVLVYGHNLESLFLRLRPAQQPCPLLSFQGKPFQMQQWAAFRLGAPYKVLPAPFPAPEMPLPSRVLCVFNTESFPTSSQHQAMQITSVWKPSSASQYTPRKSDG